MHRPDVPDVTKIKGGGLNLSEFQMKLLEKVEELAALEQTVAQLQEQNAALTAERDQLAAQQQQIDALAARLAAVEAASGGD